MNILYLGKHSPIVDFLWKDMNSITIWNDKLEVGKYPLDPKPDFVISYGYRHIIKRDVIDLFEKGTAINLHPSRLPFGRGADPVFWGIFNKEPMGVSIHCLDKGLDTGDLLAQYAIANPVTGTFRSVYDSLHKYLVLAFESDWERIKYRTLVPRKQAEGGSYHRTADKEPYMHLLTQGWDTPVSVLEGLGKDASI